MKPGARPHASALAGGPRAIRLFCFPYAGGGPSIYRGWDKGMGHAVEVVPVSLPGREHRLAESPIDDMRALAAAIAPELGSALEPPFAFFGHSMGALLAFELARLLRREGRDGPACLAVSAYRAPHLPLDRARVSDLPEPDFLDELRRLNGTPAEVLANSELLALLLPALRADFRAVELYEYTEEAPLACPILAYGGSEDDEVSEAQLQAWRGHTAGGFLHRMFDGGHFYLSTARHALVARLGADVQRAWAGAASPDETPPLEAAGGGR